MSERKHASRNAGILALWCDNHSFDDIAAQMKCSRNAVAGVIYRARLSVDHPNPDEITRGRSAIIIKAERIRDKKRQAKRAKAHSVAKTPNDKFLAALGCGGTGMSEWQAIESAPKDGTVVRVKNGYMNRSVKARFGDYHSDVTGKVYPHTWVLVEDDMEEFMPLRPGLMVVPTHWAPIKNEATP